MILQGGADSSFHNQTRRAPEDSIGATASPSFHILTSSQSEERNKALQLSMLHQMVKTSDF